MLLGEHAWTTSFGAFVRSRNGVPLNVIADLMGRRVVVADESDEDAAFNESLIKNLTGGGTVAGRQLYRETVNYRPTFKLWFGSNHRPSIRGTDMAIWRRVRLIPFEQRIPDSARDRFIMDKFAAEMPGILNWALAGLASWKEHGLEPPETVKDATRAYRSEMDVVKEFVEVDCEQSDRKSSKLATLYAEFRERAKSAGDMNPPGRRAFAERLRQLGYSTEGKWKIVRGLAPRIPGEGVL